MTEDIAGEVYHVYPASEEDEHDIISGGLCKCNPSIQTMENGNIVVVHNERTIFIQYKNGSSYRTTMPRKSRQLNLLK